MLRQLIKYNSLNKSEKAFIKNFEADLSIKKYSGTDKVLACVAFDYDLVIYYRNLLLCMSQHFNLDPVLIDVTMPAQIEGRSFKGSLYNRLAYSSLHRKKLRRLIGVKNPVFSFLSNNQSYRKYLRKAEEYLKNLNDKVSLLEFESKGLVVGYLIIDSFLRFSPSATLEIGHPFLKHVIASAFHIHDQVENYLTSNIVKTLFVPYGTYIHYGIIVRECLRREIPVFSFDTFWNGLGNKVKSDYPMQRPRYFKYSETFANLDNKDENCKLAESYLNRRFTGKVDNAISYMKTPAFGKASKQKLFHTEKPKALVMLHCFFDSPHIYRNMLFCDFYDWIVTVLSSAGQSTCQFYVKPHPNGVSGNTIVIERLKERFPDIVFLPPSTSNTAIIEEGVDCVFTVYGTVAHEFTWFGIPVINAGDNPHINYDFSITPSDRGQLKELILNPPLKPLDNLESIRQQICEFYYMHNIYQNPEALPNETFNLTQCPYHRDDSRRLLWYMDNKKPNSETLEILKNYFSKYLK